MNIKSVNIKCSHPISGCQNLPLPQRPQAVVYQANQTTSSKGSFFAHCSSAVKNVFSIVWGWVKGLFCCFSSAKTHPPLKLDIEQSENKIFLPLLTVKQLTPLFGEQFCEIQQSGGQFNVRFGLLKGSAKLSGKKSVRVKKDLLSSISKRANGLKSFDQDAYQVQLVSRGKEMAFEITAQKPKSWEKGAPYCLFSDMCTLVLKGVEQSEHIAYAEELGFESVGKDLIRKGKGRVPIFYAETEAGSYEATVILEKEARTVLLKKAGKHYNLEGIETCLEILPELIEVMKEEFEEAMPSIHIKAADNKMADQLFQWGFICQPQGGSSDHKGKTFILSKLS